MLYWFLYPLKDDFSFLRIFGYVSFRAVFAAVTALLIMFFIGPKFIVFLQKLKFKESVRKDGPQTHAVKAGTPTMGGLMVITSMTISMLLWGNLSNIYVVTTILGTILLTMVGFRDDYQKVVLKRAGGMKPKAKLLYQLIIAGAFATIVYHFAYLPKEGSQVVVSFSKSDLFLPFLKDPFINLGIIAIPFWMVVVIGSSNAVNITDGLDGLAIGLSAIVLAALAIFAYLTGVIGFSNYLLMPFIPEANELSVFLAAMVGGSIGFLWYNCYPAQVFMGDTGSLSIGGAIGMVAICIKKEVLLVILGGVFVLEILSVVLQVGSYKLRNKQRIFKMAPIHHHFELSDLHENKVVIRFWISGILLALISLATLNIT